MADKDYVIRSLNVYILVYSAVDFSARGNENPKNKCTVRVRELRARIKGGGPDRK